MRAGLLLGLLAAAACGGGGAGGRDAGGGGDPVTLTTGDTVYGPGASVNLTIVNHSPTQVAFNPCTRTVEQQAGSGWTSLDEPTRVCTMIAWLLEPDSSRTATTELPDSLPAGRYRLRLAFSSQDSTGTRMAGVSNEFRVE